MKRSIGYLFVVLCACSDAFMLTDVVSTARNRRYHPSTFRLHAKYKSLEPIATKISPVALERLRIYLNENEQLKDSTPPLPNEFIINVTSLESAFPKDENPLMMFKPSGWYRDEYEIDLKARSDPRIPDFPHPLSLIELKKYGYEDLMASIVSLGGPITAGRLIGMDWKAPIIKRIYAESLKSKRTESYALDTRGSLLLGSALDDRLSESAELDLAKVKFDLDSVLEKQANIADSASSQDHVQSAAVNPMSIEAINERIAKGGKSSSPVDNRMRSFDVVEKKKRDLDRFRLTSLERSHFCALLVSASLGWGHASAEVLDEYRWGSATGAVIHAAQIVALLLAATSGGSLFLSLSQSTEKRRDGAMWAVRALLGGPSTLRILSETPLKEELQVNEQ